MKLLITAVLATTALCASAQERVEDPPHVPAEVLSIQRHIPVVPDSRTLGSFAIHGRVDAVTAQIGSITASTVSNIGNAVPTGPSIIAPNLSNALTPRIR